MTIFQYYGLIFFYQTDQQIWPFFNVHHREEDGGNVAKLFGAELDAEGVAVWMVDPVSSNMATAMVAIPWDKNEVLEGEDHGTLKEHHL